MQACRPTDVAHQSAQPPASYPPVMHLLVGVMLSITPERISYARSPVKGAGLVDCVVADFQHWALCIHVPGYPAAVQSTVPVSVGFAEQNTVPASVCWISFFWSRSVLSSASG